MVLLGAVEAMEFVEEEDRAAARDAKALAGLVDQLAHVGNAAADGGELCEVTFGGLRDDPRESGLPGAGWSPEDDRGELVTLDHQPQRAARPDHVFLPHEPVEVARSHARGERLVAREMALRPLLEQLLLHAGRRLLPASRHNRTSCWGRDESTRDRRGYRLRSKRARSNARSCARNALRPGG